MHIIENIPNEIFDPYEYLFVNKFQTKKLTKDLEKILQRTCDYHEEIEFFNINELNNYIKLLNKIWLILKIDLVK